MRLLLLTLISSLLLSACATAPTVGPKPDVAPVVRSNAATRVSVKAARTSIHESQVKAAAGADALTNVATDLDQLLKRP
jgi:uncharacterized protein YcfL